MSSDDLIDLAKSDTDPSESKSPLHLKEDVIHENKSDLGEGNFGNEDVLMKPMDVEDLGPAPSIVQEDFRSVEGLGVNPQILQETELEKMDHKPTFLEADFKLTETVSMVEKTEEISCKLISEDGCRIVEEDNTIISRKIDASPISGAKRARMTYVGQEPSVHVMYNFLTRASKKKLEELLQQWSEWHSRHSPSTNDSGDSLQCGEETFFPALHVGKEKTSTVSFWMDEQTSQETNTFVPLDGDSVPLYDRGYVGLTSSDGSASLEGGMEKLEASRCFNCGSYGHALRECSKPRDNAAVDNARKQHNSKRGRNPGPRNPTRYYQDSSGGKYDGLRPGILGSETRQLLGLKDLDPPPWLQRMRQIGYPPGYFEPEEDDDDQPSGITIFADEENKEEVEAGQEGVGEDGEIIEKEIPEPKKKMSVEFPGINAPIPEKADKRRWASLESSSFESSRGRFQSMSPCSNDILSRGHYTDHRRSGGDYRGDPIAPPGCSPVADSSMSPYGHSYGAYDLSNGSDSQSPRLNPIPMSHGSDSQSPRLNPIPMSPSLGRSLSDRGRRSPLIHESSPSHSPHNSLPYLSPNIRQSPQSYGSPNFERWNPGSGSHHHSSNPDLGSSHRKERHDHHHHHRRK